MWGVGAANVHIERKNKYAYSENECIKNENALKEAIDVIEVVL